MFIIIIHYDLKVRETSKLCDQSTIDTFLSNVDDWLKMATGCTKDLLEELKTDFGSEI